VIVGSRSGMSELELPPEEPETRPDEMLPDASLEERMEDVSRHADKKAREQEAAEREDD
jgi:hypothetical protein